MKVSGTQVCVPAVPHFPGDESFGALDIKLRIQNIIKIVGYRTENCL